jgi:GxxExxY protein
MTNNPQNAQRDTEGLRSSVGDSLLETSSGPDRVPAPVELNATGRDSQTHAIIGAAIEVHRELGNGFLEPVYQDALSIELAQRSVPFQREVPLPIVYKKVPLATTYRADFVCFDEIIVELKALKALTTLEQARILNYLKATGLRRGLLINFGALRIECKRVVL